MYKRNWCEKRVVEQCNLRGMKMHYTKDIIDSAEHIDIIGVANSITITADVKGPSRISKRDKTYSQTHRWLEIRNNNGLRGSLFGSATHLVIASPKGWLWLDRNELAGEAVLRYIENVGKTKEGDDWHTRAVVGRNSIIIAAPYSYLYKRAQRRWHDNELFNKYYAENK